MAKRHQYVKELITHRINIINELSEKEVFELCQGLRVPSGTAVDEEDNTLEQGDGYSKENILRRLNIDMEHIDKILCDEIINHGDNLGEIDGGGDDRGGKSLPAEEDIDENEFYDTK